MQREKYKYKNEDLAKEALELMKEKDDWLLAHFCEEQVLVKAITNLNYSHPILSGTPIGASVIRFLYENFPKLNNIQLINLSFEMTGVVWDLNLPKEYMKYELP